MIKKEYIIPEKQLKKILIDMVGSKLLVEQLKKMGLEVSVVFSPAIDGKIITATNENVIVQIVSTDEYMIHYRYLNTDEYGKGMATSYDDTMSNIQNILQRR